MNAFLESVIDLLGRVRPVVSWMLFIIVVFALIGIAVRFYTFFDSSNYTYYKPKLKSLAAVKTQPRRRQKVTKKAKRRVKRKA